MQPQEPKKKKKKPKKTLTWTTQQFADANVRDTHAFGPNGKKTAHYNVHKGPAKCEWYEGRQPSKEWMKRVMKEFKFLRQPDTLPKGQAFVVFDDEKLHLLKFMLVPSAPYDGGFFEFDLCIPPEYPNLPPRVLLKTTGNGLVKKGREFPNLGPISASGFNPNLYYNGKVCLSILGTFHGPSWKPDTGSIYQVIVSILGLIFGTDCPPENEPGFNPTPQLCDAYIKDLRRAIDKYASVVPPTFLSFVKNDKSPKKKPKPKNKIPESCQNFNQIEIQSGWEPLGDIRKEFLIMLNVKDSENNDWKMCYNLIDLKEYINEQIKEKRKNIYLSIYRNEQDAAPALHHLLAEKEQDYSKMIKLNDKLLTKIKRAYNLLLKKNKKEVIQYYKENIGGTEEEIIKKLPFAELIDCDKEWKKKKKKAKIPCQYDKLVSVVISDHTDMIAFHIIHKSNLKILKDKYKDKKIIIHGLPCTIDNGYHLDHKMYRDIIGSSKWTIEMPGDRFKYTDVKSNDYKYFKNNNNDNENYTKYCDLDSSQRPGAVIIALNKLWDENKLLKYKNGKWIFNLEKMIGNHKNYKNKIGLEYFNNRKEESKLTRQILEEGGILPAGTKNKDLVNGGHKKWDSLSKKYDYSFDSENPNYSFYQLWKSFANTLNYMEYHESAEY